MKLTFYGAAKEVTGSCYLLEVSGFNLLIDCGLAQGHDAKNAHQLLFDASRIDAVIVSHAHIDHSGRLPLLIKNGFAGKIHATEATCDLMSIMLLDSAQIQEADAEWANAKHRRSGEKRVEPLYSVAEARQSIARFVSHRYGEEIDLAEGVNLRFSDAGHLLGSASIELWLKEGAERRKIVFSGDIGNINQPIIKDPEPLQEADFVLMESTYGDRNHEHARDYVSELAQIIDETLARGGNVILPAFAVGRTQELLYLLREIEEQKLVHSRPHFEVYLDSPLAIEATKIYERDLGDYADPKTIAMLQQGYDPIRFPHLHFCSSSEDSRALNADPTPKVILASGGMCEGGRVRHHLKHNLWRSESSVVFVGFQAAGTLGRQLIDGATHVDLLGDEIAVKAAIKNFKRLSAHADKQGLIDWLTPINPKPQHVFVVHGEAAVASSFASSLGELGYNAHAPNFRESYDLLQDSIVNAGVIDQRKRTDSMTAPDALAKLRAAERQLGNLIARKQHAADSEISRLADQIFSLLRKWK